MTGWDARSESFEALHPPRRRPLPEGPWTTEPTKVSWIDGETDLDCLIVRGPMTALCGYVGVPPGHPWHGKAYDEIDPNVHGGLTFANSCDEDGPICHVPAEGRPADVWWLGFDCAHCFDLVPCVVADLGHPMAGDVYRDVAYVRSEVESLARQARDAA